MIGETYQDLCQRLRMFPRAFSGPGQVLFAKEQANKHNKLAIFPTNHEASSFRLTNSSHSGHIVAHNVAGIPLTF